MPYSNKKIYQWGVMISCLGGFLVALSMSNLQGTPWEDGVAIGGAILAFIGLYMVVRGQKK